MARLATVRPCKQVSSSGSLTRPTKLTSGRKQFGLRKGCHSDVESGCSLYSTDSNDQVDTSHNRLDSCAALLKNILENEATGRKTTHKQPGKTSSVRVASKPLLTKGNVSKKKRLKKAITPGCQNVTALTYQLPTSTSAPSLQHSANSLCIQADNPVDSEYAPETGGPVFCSVVCDAPASAGQIESAAAPPSMIPCRASGASTVPTAFISSSSGGEITPNHEQQTQEADLIRCIRAHLALLKTHEVMNSRTEQKCHHHCPAIYKVSSNKEGDTFEGESKGMVSGDDHEDELSVIEVTPVRGTTSKTSLVKKPLKSRKERPEETAHEVKTVEYLLGELRALITDQDDPEMLQLVSDIEDYISLLPAAVGNMNVQAEIALALQPLMSENAQLRRKLRILNQQLGERERNKMMSGQSCNCDFSLQSLNVVFQSQLKESLKGLESLQAKNEELLKIIQSQKEENKHLAETLQDKEEEFFEKKHHYDIHSTKLKIEIEEALANVKSLQFKLEASEKENKILGITLRQRDAEVNRLRELTRTLQGGMAKLLSDLTVDNMRSKHEKGLSKSLLEDHEKQMQPNEFPRSTSVMTYLNKLEMDHILTDTELQFSNKSGDLEMQNLTHEKFAAEGSKINNTFSEGASAPRILPNSLNKDADTISDAGTLIDDQNKLDETVYIPLTSSTSEKQQPISERTGVLPKSREACKRLNYHCGNSNFMQQNGAISKDPALLDKLSAGYNMKKTMENILEVTGDKVKPEGNNIQVRPRGTPSGPAKNFPDKPQPGTYPLVPMLFSEEISQEKRSEITDFGSVWSDDISGRSEWSASSFSTFTSRDEEDFKNSLAALDANIARLQRTLQNSIVKQ